MRSKSKWLLAAVVILLVAVIVVASIPVFTGGPIIDSAGRPWRVPL